MAKVSANRKGVPPAFADAVPTVASFALAKQSTAKLIINNTITSSSDKSLAKLRILSVPSFVFYKTISNYICFYVNVNSGM